MLRFPHRAAATMALSPARPEPWIVSITSHTSGPTRRAARRPEGPSRKAIPGWSSIRRPSSMRRSAVRALGSPRRRAPEFRRESVDSLMRMENGLGGDDLAMYYSVVYQTTALGSAARWLQVLASYLHLEAAVDGEDRARDVARVVLEQEGDHPGNLIGATE